MFVPPVLNEHTASRGDPDTTFCKFQIAITSAGQAYVEAKEQGSAHMAGLGHFRWLGYPTICGVRTPENFGSASQRAVLPTTTLCGCPNHS